MQLHLKTKTELTIVPLFYGSKILRHTINLIRVLQGGEEVSQTITSTLIHIPILKELNFFKKDTLLVKEIN